MNRWRSPPLFGVGTAQCEALSSYVQRLSCLHGTYPGQIVHRLLPWVADGNHKRVGCWKGHPRGLYAERGINCFAHARQWVSVLTRLLDYQVLEPATTVRWDSNFPTRGFQHAQLRWCPACLAGDAQPYHRLAWQIGPVAACPEHNQLLQQECSRCRRPLPTFHDRLTILECPYCRGDLRFSKTMQRPDEFDLWTARQVGEIIAVAGRNRSSLDIDCWSWFQRHMTLCGFRSDAAVARHLGTSKVTVWCWHHQTARISLPWALRIAWCFGVDFANLATGTEPEVSNARQQSFHLRQRASPRRIDWDMVGKELAVALSQSGFGAISVHSIAQRLGINKRTIRAHFPAEVKMLSSKYRAHRDAQRADRDRSLRDSIASAIRKLRDSGLEIRQVSLEKAMKQPGLFDRMFARKCLRDVMTSSAAGEHHREDFH